MLEKWALVLEFQKKYGWSKHFSSLHTTENAHELFTSIGANWTTQGPAVKRHLNWETIKPLHKHKEHTKHTRFKKGLKTEFKPVFVFWRLSFVNPLSWSSLHSITCYSSWWAVWLETWQHAAWGWGKQHLQSHQRCCSRWRMQPTQPICEQCQCSPILGPLCSTFIHSALSCLLDSLHCSRSHGQHTPSLCPEHKRVPRKWNATNIAAKPISGKQWDVTLIWCIILLLQNVTCDVILLCRFSLIF